MHTSGDAIETWSGSDLERADAALRHALDEDTRRLLERRLCALRLTTFVGVLAVFFCTLLLVLPVFLSRFGGVMLGEGAVPFLTPLLWVACMDRVRRALLRQALGTLPPTRLADHARACAAPPRVVCRALSPPARGRWVSDADARSLEQAYRWAGPLIPPARRGGVAVLTLGLSIAGALAVVLGVPTLGVLLYAGLSATDATLAFLPLLVVVSCVLAAGGQQLSRRLLTGAQRGALEVAYGVRRGRGRAAGRAAAVPAL